MLSPYRVLDLTDSRAELGPMILGDLGADVIKVEPPGGSTGRAAPTAGPRSQIFNRNKRSVTLDLESEAGRQDFLRLVASADFLFENERPGGMAARGLGFDDLRRVNPRLVYVAITPFGQDGPYAKHLATDLTLAAMGGMVALNGDADRPPLRISLPQVWLHASAESAAAALVAHQRRVQTGAGQFVDVAVQTAVFWMGLNAMIAHAIQGRDIERNGTILPLGTINMRVLYPCADGMVLAAVVSGRALVKLVPWLVEAGIVPESWLTDEDWTTYDTRLLGQQPLAHPWEELMGHLETFLLPYTKQELLERGIAEGIFIAPVNTIEDVLRFQHLEARGYWQPFELADGRTLRAPGPWVRFGATPICYRQAPPRPGEHTESVLGALPRTQRNEEPAQ